MATGFRLLYGKVCCGVCCLLFKPSRKKLPDPEKGLLDTGEEIIVQTKVKSAAEIQVPTSVCILLMTSYILLGTLLFCMWEKWDFVTGTYFSFITLSTIGFGDVVPGMATSDWAVKEKLVLCALYLVIGLSLIAMCFNLVQEDVKAKFRWLGSKIGLFDKNKWICCLFNAVLLILTSLFVRYMYRFHKPQTIYPENVLASVILLVTKHFINVFLISLWYQARDLLIFTTPSPSWNGIKIVYDWNVKCYADTQICIRDVCNLCECQDVMVMSNRRFVKFWQVLPSFKLSDVQ